MTAKTNGTQRVLFITIALLLFPSVAVHAQSTPNNSGISSVDINAFKTLDQQVETAFQRGDAAFLNTTLGDDFRFTHARGTVQGKTETIANFAKPGNFASRTVTSVVAEVHDDVALTSGRIEIRASSQRDYTTCYVRLYARRAGQWRLLSHRVVRLADGFSETCSPR